MLNKMYRLKIKKTDENLSDQQIAVKRRQQQATKVTTSSAATSISSQTKTTTSEIDRKFWAEFLILYQSQTALWNTNDPHYKDRAAKITCYDLLRQKLCEKLPNATHDDVLKRINIFRTNYRRERSRLMKYRQRDCNYKTPLWYYNLLSFLEPQLNMKTKSRNKNEPTVKMMGNLKNEIKNEQQHFGAHDAHHMHVIVDESAMQHDEDDDAGGGDVDFTCSDGLTNNINCHGAVDDGDDVKANYFALAEHIDFEPETMQAAVSSNTIKSSTAAATAIDEYLVTTEDSNEVMASATTTADAAEIIDVNVEAANNVPSSSLTTATTMFGSQTSNRNDYHMSAASEILARSWAVQYDEMTTEQKIFARKEIADILYAGCMGTLGIKDS